MCATAYSNENSLVLEVNISDGELVGKGHLGSATRLARVMRQIQAGRHTASARKSHGNVRLFALVALVVLEGQ